VHEGGDCGQSALEVEAERDVGKDAEDAPGDGLERLPLEIAPGLRADVLDTLDVYRAQRGIGGERRSDLPGYVSGRAVDQRQTRDEIAAVAVLLDDAVADAHAREGSPQALDRRGFLEAELHERPPAKSMP
jgi:hypothetical protein